MKKYKSIKLGNDGLSVSDMWLSFKTTKAYETFVLQSLRT